MKRRIKKIRKEKWMMKCIMKVNKVFKEKKMLKKKEIEKN
jgi:hypothetical protein